MTLFAQILPASFQGVTFYVDGSKTSGGRKDVRHEFPNSNRQTIEDLGLKPRIHNITAITIEPNYVQNRDNLLRVLESGRRGVLIHPFYGQIENMKARTYTLDEQFKELGVAKFEIVFEPDDADGRPRQSLNTASVIADQTTAVNQSIETDFANTFSISPTAPNNFQAAETKLDSLSDSFVNSIDSVVANTDQINNFTQMVSNFRNNIPSLTRNPAGLGAEIRGTVETVKSLYTDPADQLTALGTLFDFGNNDQAINLTTRERRERKTNNDIINASVQALALSEAYLSSVQIPFNTVDSIDNVSNQLESVYQNVRSIARNATI